MDQPQKEATIAITTLGHIDHGKSTSLGHFLFLLGVIDQRTMDKLAAESDELKRSTWKWAYVLDSTDEERAGGITADIAFQPFKTKTGKSFMLIDAPGHRDFVKNAIKGAVQTDACILMVSVVPNDLKAGLKEGGINDPGGQTREHAILGSVLGIQSVIVCINKMDMVSYSQDAYFQAVDAIKTMLKDIQSPWLRLLTTDSFIPMSGLEGDNLIEKSPNMSWYTGPTLIEALDKLKPIQRPLDIHKLRFIVFDTYDLPGAGNYLYGRLVSGTIKVDQEIIVLPAGEKGTIKDILDDNIQPLEKLFAGDFGSIQVKGLDRDQLNPGAIIAPVQNFPSAAKQIQARVLILETAGRPLVPGSSVILHVGLTHSAAVIDKIVKIERQNKQRRTDKIMLAFPGELVVLELTPDHPIIVERYKDQQILGRVVLRHSGNTIAVGLITEIIN